MVLIGQTIVDSYWKLARYCGDLVNKLLNKPQKQPCDFSIEYEYKTVKRT